MSKSLKLSNSNYWDSTGIVHNQELLSDILGNSDTTDNGSYIKFPDGTMICWIYKTITANVTNLYGNGIYQTSYVWTYPATFISAPAVTSGEFCVSGKLSWGSTYQATTTYAYLRIYDIVSTESATCRFSAIAIGKWK